AENCLTTIGGLISSTFCCGAPSTSAAGEVTSAGVFSAGSAGGGGSGGSCAGADRAVLDLVSSDARIREIGGKTARFVLISPSGDFFAGRFRSISETLSGCGVAWPGTSGFFALLLRRLAGAGRGAPG